MGSAALLSGSKYSNLASVSAGLETILRHTVRVRRRLISRGHDDTLNPVLFPVAGARKSSQTFNRLSRPVANPQS